MAGGRRAIGRHLAPGFLASLWHYLRSRALVSPRARVQLGNGISFGPGTVVKPFAVIQSSGGAVRFGRECAVSSFVHVSTGEGDVVLGDYVRIAPNCTLVGGTKAIPSRHALIKDQGESAARGLSIGDDVLIGAGAVVLPGVSIGRGAVVGAGSVVNESVPEYAVVAGAPARVIGRRE